jgi:hypothetical protein
VRALHAACLLLGAGLFVLLVREVGADELLRESALLGWGVLAIVAVEGLADLLHAAGWQRCFPAEARPRLRELWAPHLAGAAVNLVTPTATLGGELVRGSLAPRGAGADGVTASLAVNKLAAALADTTLVLAGALVALAWVPLGSGARAAMLGASGLLAAGVVGFGAVQRRGRLAGLLAGRSVVALVLGHERAERWSATAASIDRRIAALHAEGGRAVREAVVLHTIGNAIGALQLHLFFTMVGVPSHLATVGTVFLLARAIDVIAFLVPGRIGAQEGARMFAMSLVGIAPSLGLLFSLVLRLEQLVWAGVGFAAYGVLVWQRRGTSGVVQGAR